MENTTTQQEPIAVPEQLNPQQALSILIQAVNFAQSKGVYSLEDAEILSKAVKVFVTKNEAQPAAPAPEGEVTAPAPEATA
jgi:hypothetical protein